MEFEVIGSIDDLIKNIETLESYSVSPNQEEKKFYSYLFSRGRTFLLVRRRDKVLFGPSKFIGYKNNTMDLFYKNRGNPKRTMSGVETNGIISELLKKRPKKNLEYEKILKDYYVDRDLKYNNFKKKFWELVIVK